MLVKDYMLRHPIMIEPEKGVVEAQRLMVENHLYYLPVVGDGKRLMGMITPPRLAIPPEKMGSLDVWEITRYLNTLTVGKVMIKDKELFTIAPDATIEEAAAFMIKNNSGGLPVVEEDHVVVGLITDKDLLVELRNLLGAVEPGWRITMRVPSRRGEFNRLIEAITSRGWGIMAMGNVRAPKHEDRWDIVLKIWGCNRTELISVLEGLADQEIRDVRETTSHLDV